MTIGIVIKQQCQEFDAHFQYLCRTVKTLSCVGLGFMVVCVKTAKERSDAFQSAKSQRGTSKMGAQRLDLNLFRGVGLGRNTATRHANM